MSVMRVFTNEFLSNFEVSYVPEMDLPEFIDFEKYFIELFNLQMAILLLQNKGVVEEKNKLNAGKHLMKKMLERFDRFEESATGVMSFWGIVNTAVVLSAEEYAHTNVQDGYEQVNYESYLYRQLYFLTEKCRELQHNIEYVEAIVEYLFNIIAEIANLKFEYKKYVLVAQEVIRQIEEKGKTFEKAYSDRAVAHALLNIDVAGGVIPTKYLEVEKFTRGFLDWELDELERKSDFEKRHLEDIISSGYSADTGQFKIIFMKQQTTTKTTLKKFTISGQAEKQKPLKISELFRVERYKYKLSQSELAEKLDITQKQVSRIEKGETMPKGYALVKFCVYFKITPAKLFATCPEAKLIAEKTNYAEGSFQACYHKLEMKEPPTPSTM